MRSLERFAVHARRLAMIDGRTCTRARRGYGGSLHVDFGALGPPGVRGYQQAELVLVCECPWRLDDDTQVIVGFHDAQEFVWTRIQTLIGRRFGPSDVLTPSYTVRMSIEGDLVLWFFPVDAKDYLPAHHSLHVPWYVTGYAVPDEE
jgi:hypothetical protein